MYSVCKQRVRDSISTPMPTASATSTKPTGTTIRDAGGAPTPEGPTTNSPTTGKTSTTTPLFTKSTKERPVATSQSSSSRTPTGQTTTSSTPTRSAPTNSRNSSGTRGDLVGLTTTTTSPTSTTTNTVTDVPDSTFSTPVAVTTTHGGSTEVITPAFLTVVATSTDSNGSVVSWTHVVMNPSQEPNRSSHPFLENTGAVAGVFAVVGIIAASMILCVAYYIRRIRRTRRQSRWLATLQALRNEEPDRIRLNHDDPDNFPQMRSIAGGSTVGHETSLSHVSPVYDGISSYRPRETHFGGTGVPGLDLGRRFVDEGPFSDYHAYQPDPIGIVPLPVEYQGAGHILKPVSPTSIAESSPSIYPASLPPIDDGDEETTGQRIQENTDSHRDLENQKPETYIVEAPPRPPRSRLRTLTSKDLYITPPPSSGSSSDASPISGLGPDYSPVKGPRAILARRTLLDVRPRSAQYSTDTSSNGHT
ncbi:hypothetical protein AMATHDRAFT_44326 [Amanita thiersii Skay4041]|uniref:Uncharacterized protein n=1 Tax=Amanita thiersii Skay4041 TaxID=703135 RepID=A0A2A9NWD0_9AGAR|nr:hypothetical protein AMATHDRAFT_44326 [Amanita thiersii Skay4041]